MSAEKGFILLSRDKKASKGIVREKDLLKQNRQMKFNTSGNYLLKLIGIERSPIFISVVRSM